jgi:protein-tyrosine phosphatase
VTQADLILTMSDSQTKWIENQWPHSRGKTFKLGHWSNKDIADPYKLDDQAFITAKQDIVSSLKQWTDKVS